MGVRQRRRGGIRQQGRDVVWGLLGFAFFAAVPSLGAQSAPPTTSALGAEATSPTRGAQAEDGLTILRIGGGTASDAIEIDGRLDEAAWARAEVATGFTQKFPAEGSPATQNTEVRILVDNDAIYIGARLSDQEADRIVARLARRDENVHADWFYVYLDSYDDDRTAFGFGVNAAGVQRDLRIAEDNREDASWDAVWASAVEIDGGGWSAELRIPLTQLRFNTPDANARWGANFFRRLARENEEAHWAPVPRGVDRFVSLFGEIRGVQGIEPSRRMEIIPYTVARLTRAPESPGNPFYRSTDPFGTMGADVRFGLGSSLTLSATLNPDFGQVEADPATVNLTAFETFQEERRPFFVEGSDIFSLSFPFWPPFFYSRRIGRNPQGSLPSDAAFRDTPNATTILGAVKLSGKTENGWSIGLMDAVTGSEHGRFADGAGVTGRALVEPRTNSAVARVAKEFRDGESGVGVMATSVRRDLGGSVPPGPGSEKSGQEGSRLDFLHDQAYGFAVDAFHRFGGGNYIANVSVLTSHVRGSETAIQRTQNAAGHYFQRPDADHLSYDPTRRSLSGTSVTARVQRNVGSWKWGVFAEAASPGFENSDLGFNPTLDDAQTNAWVNHQSFEPGRIFRNWNAGTSASIQSSWGAELKQLSNEAWFSSQLLNYWGGGLWVMRRHPAWSLTALRGGPAVRRPGGWTGNVNVNSDPRKSLTGDAFLFWETEDETGAYTTNASANVTLRPSDRMDVRLGPSLGFARSAWQYVGRRDVDDGPLWLVGDLDRRTVSLSTRINVTTSPSTSLQIYARPFLASGRYRALREVTNPRADAFDARFRTYPRLQGPDGEPFQLDRDNDGVTDLTVSDPSFNIASLQMNTVLRWEYRPGSTLFLVWTHDRDRFGQQELDVGRDLDRLLEAPARNVFMVKLSYWIGV